MQTKPPKSTEKGKELHRSDETIRGELGKITKSEAFSQVDRLQRFLAFIVEETLSGRGDSLKEHAVGVAVFAKESTFDPRMDPIVRVQARRLRIRLATYYRDEGRDAAIIIDLPKGGYSPVFRQRDIAIPERCADAAAVARNKVMVLPFSDFSPMGDQESFCRSLSREVVLFLAQEDAIVLVKHDPAADLKRAQGVPAAAMVLSGSVRKCRDVLRITMHLSDAVRDCFVWSHFIDRNPEDLLAVQEEVAQTVLRVLRAQLVGEPGKRGSRHQRENAAAHNMYVQGRYYLNQRTEQGLLKALEFFSKAVLEDPELAQAYSGLADAHNLLAHYGVLAPADVGIEAVSNAAHAVELDEDSAEAHTSLAHVKATLDWDWAGAEREFQRAIQLNPRYSTAHHWYAMSCLVPLGRLEEALEEMLLAQALDPISSVIARDAAVLHYYRRNYELALEQCDHTIEQNPHFSAAYWTLGLIQEQREDFDEAVAAFQRAIELSPPSPRILGALGRTLAMAGRTEEAVRILRDLDHLAKTRYISPFELALIYFALNRLDEGFERLTTAYQDHCFELIAVKADPRFDAVMTDPRYEALFKQLGLPQER